MRILQRSSMILSSLPPQMTTQLFACAFKRAAKAGEALFFEQGPVKITVTSDRGEERIIALVGEGEIIGELHRSPAAVGIGRHLGRPSIWHRRIILCHETTRRTQAVR